MKKGLYWARCGKVWVLVVYREGALFHASDGDRLESALFQEFVPVDIKSPDGRAYDPSCH